MDHKQLLNVLSLIIVAAFTAVITYYFTNRVNKNANRLKILKPIYQELDGYICNILSLGKRFNVTGITSESVYSGFSANMEFVNEIYYQHSAIFSKKINDSLKRLKSKADKVACIAIYSDGSGYRIAHISDYNDISDHAIKNRRKKSNEANILLIAVLDELVILKREFYKLMH